MLKIALKIATQVGILLLSYGLVFATKKSGVALTAAEEIVTTVALFSAGLLIELLVTMAGVSAQRDTSFRLWETTNQGESKLHNIRALFGRLVEGKYSESDLFIDYFLRQFDELERAIRSATERNELTVHSHHFESADSVLAAFSGETNAVHRYTWVLRPGEALFPDEASTRYFQLVDEMVRKKQIREVQALFVVENLDVLNDRRIAKLLEFFKTNRCFDCRVALQSAYDHVRADSQIPSDYIDFGIYGSRLMFLTEKYEPETVGVFVKDAGRVARYSMFFDKLWNSPVSRNNPSTAQTKVSFAELVRFDQLPP